MKDLTVVRRPVGPCWRFRLGGNDALHAEGFLMFGANDWQRDPASQWHFVVPITEDNAAFLRELFDNGGQLPRPAVVAEERQQSLWR